MFIFVYLIRGILVRGIKVMFKVLIFCLFVFLGDLGDLGDLVYCLVVFFNSIYNFFILLLFKWLCIVCSKNVICLKRSYLMEILLVFFYMGGFCLWYVINLNFDFWFWVVFCYKDVICRDLKGN